MCGRYTLATPVERLAEAFGVGGSLPELSPNYNVAPTQEVAAVLVDGDERRLEMLRWGLIPSWAKDPEIGARMINARSETVPEKPSFRSAFRKRRCLIPADGFYEWQKTNNGKQPFYARMRDGSPFAFAGLWESWRDNDGPEVRTCTILTTNPNELMAQVHNRMPVILPPDYYGLWLDPDAEEDALTELFDSYPDEAMETYPVSRFVNSPSNNDERCGEPAAGEPDPKDRSPT
ncbi:MAG: SOS response-associated peptidase [Rubrobacteraceae bacterium]